MGDTSLETALKTSCQTKRAISLNHLQGDEQAKERTSESFQGRFGAFRGRACKRGLVIGVEEQGIQEHFWIEIIAYERPIT